MGKKDEEFIIILETAKVFSAQELAIVQATDEMPVSEMDDGEGAGDDSNDETQ
jgi:purine-binding chemotaxis protein CheW